MSQNNVQDDLPIGPLEKNEMNTTTPQPENSDQPDPRDGSGRSASYAAFIAHDWCGWNNQHGRFTAMPNGETLVSQGWMNQSQWDRAQLEWFRRFDGHVTVHECPGVYSDTAPVMGTVADIRQRLEGRLSVA